MSSIPDDFATANDPETLTRRIAERFCAGMLSAALPKRLVSSLTANYRVVVILEAPSPDWVDYLEDYLREAFPQAPGGGQHRCCRQKPPKGDQPELGSAAA